MSTQPYKYPLPLAEADDEPFFEAAKRHELVAQQCVNCKQFQHPPGQTCPNCYGEIFEWVKLSGRGTIYSFVVAHQPTNPAFLDKVPYNIVEVEPEDAHGIHFIGDVVNTDNANLKVGMPVQAFFDDVDPEVTLVRWEPR